MSTFSANDRLKHFKTIYEALFCIFTKYNPTKYPDISDMPGDRVAPSEIDDLLTEEEKAYRAPDAIFEKRFMRTVILMGVIAGICFILTIFDYETETVCKICIMLLMVAVVAVLIFLTAYWLSSTFNPRIVHRRIVKRLCKFHPSTLIDYIEQAKCEVNQEVNPDSQQAPPLPPRRRVLRRK